MYAYSNWIFNDIIRNNCNLENEKDGDKNDVQSSMGKYLFILLGA